MKKYKEIELNYNVSYTCPNKNLLCSINKSDILYRGMFGWNEGYYDSIDEAYISIKCPACNECHKIYFKK